MLLIRKDHIENLEKVISDSRSWVVSIKSAGNILRGENYVYAFPEARLNKSITRKGEIIATEKISLANSDSESIRKKIKILLSSTLAEVKKRGSLSSELKVNANQINNLGKNLVSRKKGDVEIIAKAIDNSQSADKVPISLELQFSKKGLRTNNK